jgi:hypothetical protein
VRKVNVTGTLRFGVLNILGYLIKLSSCSEFFFLQMAGESKLLIFSLFERCTAFKKWIKDLLLWNTNPCYFSGTIFTFGLFNNAVSSSDYGMEW